MKANKGLGSNAVLSLSHDPVVVKQRDFREVLIEILGMLGWLWFVWYLINNPPPLP